MDWFKNLKLGVKLLTGFIIVSAIGIGVGIFAETQLQTLEKADSLLYEKMTIPVGSMGKVNTAFQRMRCNLIESATFINDPARRDDQIKRAYERDAEIEKLFAEYEGTILTQNGRDKFNGMVKSYQEFDRVEKEFTSLIRAGKQEAALTLWTGRLEDLRKAFQAESDEVMKTKIDLARETALENVALADRASTLIFTVLAIGFAVSILFGVLITRMITRPVNEALHAANRLAEGDLTVKIEVNGKDEAAMLLAAMKNMIEKLSHIVSDVQAAADNVASGSQELSSSSQEMSQGATEQAASIEEVSSSMEEMSANIQQNTDNARQTEQIAIKAAKDAQEGGEAVIKTVSAMKEIAEKISIIEEIARQTNLLALNAAIEAARAGEAGKGFAVVASEVRKLAERSQAAANQISSLSGSSVEIAEKAGVMLAKIVPDIQRTAELVQEVAASSVEQSTGAGQVNKAIQQLDTVVQQNASASEEMASTAEELSSQAEQLQDSIAFFKIDGGDRRGQQMRRDSRAPRIAHAASGGSRAKAPVRAIPAARTAKGGIALDLDTGHDDDFERY